VHLYLNDRRKLMRLHGRVDRKAAEWRAAFFTPSNSSHLSNPHQPLRDHDAKSFVGEIRQSCSSLFLVRNLRFTRLLHTLLLARNLRCARLGLKEPLFRWWRSVHLLNSVSVQVELMLTEREITATEGA
jgi:hypothetical protein